MQFHTKGSWTYLNLQRMIGDYIVLIITHLSGDSKPKKMH